ncbi:hypothetical protein N8Z26_06895 [Burkholderiales bacterium]|nr:hypothetical protein [Burkholderiales bacterium]
MKKTIIFLASFLFISSVYALPECQEHWDRWDDCQGTIIYNNSDTYIGEWKNNQWHGQGAYTYGPESQMAGEMYIGGFREGERHGRGRYTYPNGTWYSGEWRDGNMFGKGVYTFSDGRKYIGEWINNEFIEDVYVDD